MDLLFWLTFFTTLSISAVFLLPRSVARPARRFWRGGTTFPPQTLSSGGNKCVATSPLKVSVLAVQTRPAFLLAALLLTGCSFTGKDSNTVPPNGWTSSWKNIYKGNPLLAGVEVNQFSGDWAPGLKSLSDYDGKHPAQIIYYFWNGRLERLNYLPNGRMFHKEVSKSPILAGSPDLDFIDFSYGSDPHFLKHPDPRRKVKMWVNLYQNDPQLAGIEIDQEPREGDVYNDRSRYDSRHPYQIDYYFWDGRSRSMSYTPYGDIQDDQWEPRIKAGSPFWDDVDFSYGSDPQFKKHKDPRNKSSGSQSN